MKRRTKQFAERLARKASRKGPYKDHHQKQKPVSNSVPSPIALPPLVQPVRSGPVVHKYWFLKVENGVLKAFITSRDAVYFLPCSVISSPKDPRAESAHEIQRRFGMLPMFTELVDVQHNPTKVEIFLAKFTGHLRTVESVAEFMPINAALVQRLNRDDCMSLPSLLTTIQSRPEFVLAVRKLRIKPTLAKVLKPASSEKQADQNSAPATLLAQKAA